MATGRPLVSVLFGTLYRWEGLELLRRSIRSILLQTMTDFECLIVDDGSSEAARAYLTACAARDARIRLIRPGRCFSLPQKLNACLRAARGAYFARMDDDDYSHPARFACELAALRAHPEIAFVGSCAYLVRNGVRVGERVFPRFPAVRDFYFTQPFLHPSLLFRREAMFAVSGYSEDERCELCEDYDLLLRLYERGLRGMNLSARLIDYTVPQSAKEKRHMRHRLNETVTRWRRFRALGVLPGALPYVVKPLVVGLLPERVLARWNHMGHE